ncbi:MAG: hypothetical protein AABX31_00340 [Nanoarchaeota archaeon]
MEEWVEKKLLELGYDPAKKSDANYESLRQMCKGFLGGLVLVEGSVLVRDKCQYKLPGDYNIIMGAKTQNSLSLYQDLFQQTFPKDDPRIINFNSLYINSLAKDASLVPGVYVDRISPHDRIDFRGVTVSQHLRHFCMFIKDERGENEIASFYFRLREMLYVPKRAKSE